MNKLRLSYLFGTTLPVIILFFEYIIPIDDLEDLTILAEEIKLTNLSGSFFTLIIICLGFFILSFFLKKTSYTYKISFSKKSLWILSSYSGYRLLNSFFIFINTFGLGYSRNQISEFFTKPGLQGLIIQLLNGIYPIVVSLVVIAYFSISRFELDNKADKFKKKLLLFQIILFAISSTLFDLVRSSRGNITFLGLSFLVGFLMTKHVRIKLLNFKNYFISFIIFLLITFSFFASTYIRHYQILNNYNINIIENVKLISFLHDTTVYKAVGGQLVTNRGISGDLYLWNNIVDYDDDFIGGSRDIVSILGRDSYCKRFDCLKFFQPLHIISRIFGYNKEGSFGSIFVYFDSRFPFNSFSHLGALYLAFNRKVAPIIYLLLLSLNVSLIKSKNLSLEFISVFNLLYFSFLAFTDNWYISLFPYLSIAFILFSKNIGIKIYKSS